MINRFTSEKKFFGVIIGILILFAIVTMLLWSKIPNEIYIPFRWNGQRDTGFYEKNLQNVIYVFVTPFLGIMIIKIANILVLGGRDDLFSSAISQSLDLICYLLGIFGPIAFFVCTFFQNSTLSYGFYLIGLVTLIVNFKNKGYR